MKRVLFVDDEPQVLEGLRDSLRGRRREWMMRFALGGEAALEELAANPFDVVVSDMRMPGMDGATLLGYVRDQHPAAVRIVLSGYAERDIALRAAAVAHLFLAKPCTGESLRLAVDRACALQSLLSDQAERRGAAGAAALPSPPAVQRELAAALEDETADAAAIARILQRDIAMTAKVLQLVNSAFFGLGREISSVTQAVAYLGLDTLRALVLSASVFHAFEPVSRIEGFSLERLQWHGLVVANVARALVGSGPGAMEAYTAGMLHDIGLLIAASGETAELAAAFETARRDGLSLHQVELEHHGYTHAEAGAYLLGLWGLPPAIVEAVALHHNLHDLPVAGLDATCAVHLANQLANEAGSFAVMGIPSDPVAEDLVAAVGRTDELPHWREIAAQEAQVSES
jgi:HD-like signal output (HDOD) protein